MIRVAGLQTRVSALKGAETVICHRRDFEAEKLAYGLLEGTGMALFTLITSKNFTYWMTAIKLTEMLTEKVTLLSINEDGTRLLANAQLITYIELMYVTY